MYHTQSLSFVLRCCLYIVFLWCVFFTPQVWAESPKSLIICGVAKGFPPYQYQSMHDEATGLDVDVMRALANHLHKPVLFQQATWNEVMTQLRLNKTDCIAGIEINAKRLTYFDFTTPYYMRKVVVFVREDNTEIHTIHDLRWQVVAGDRDSFVEAYFNDIGLRSQIRLYQTESKDKSVQMLKKGTVVAMIAPLEVGLHLAKRYAIKVRIIENSDPGSPVAIAVKKGNSKLLHRIEAALQILRESGELDAIITKWRPQNP
ncbi:transporter substrate-binding domain-containing protein [Pseudodesulfovibrio sp. JC047]|uniref:transporter substrate-binding domain-containing protein n=1 Tax=Pseudodesulfovibrio sp. JC047 TaxID=2683199 RepID=UPI0013D89128|nr:transporter substrate-binding domain-containing protein [Pseudodesulfovibrio sp. JC047]NDV19194.1 transporter substrate-binding domain-containing protein [Pseudodesulfovibrio sp. JC047]